MGGKGGEGSGNVGARFGNISAGCCVEDINSLIHVLQCQTSSNAFSMERMQELRNDCQETVNREMNKDLP